MNNCLFPKFTNVYWWDLKDVMNYILNGTYSTPISKTDSEWYGVIESLSATQNIGYFDFENSTTSKITDGTDKILNEIIKRYWYHYCFSTKNSEIGQGSDFRSEVDKFMIKILNVIQYTYKKYSKLLTLYENEKNNLMKQLESEVEGGTRFNDTPQDTEIAFDEVSPSFATTMTKNKSKTKSDSDTPIKKLAEIERNYSNVLLLWLNEFDSLFVEENNV